LYKLARRGVEVERELRTVTIYDLELLELQQEYVSLKVHCSKGTYIRTLVEDIGNALGCGAHVVALRRVQASCYLLEHAMTIEVLQQRLLNKCCSINDLLLPVDSALTNWPEIIISDFAAACLIKGQQIAVKNVPAYGFIRIKTESDDRFIGLGEILGPGMVAPKRMINVNVTNFSVNQGSV
jgi:tRNA pseudouridine55 synthase